MGMDLFLQAEDGIRVAQESRGLGDVYKRQVVEYEPLPAIVALEDALKADAQLIHEDLEQNPVSYTHLTLPTIYTV